MKNKIEQEKLIGEIFEIILPFILETTDKNYQDVVNNLVEQYGLDNRKKAEVGLVLYPLKRMEIECDEDIKGYTCLSTSFIVDIILEEWDSMHKNMLKW